MSKLEVDAIEPQSGTTLTLGASGDSVTLGSGASLTSPGLTLSDNILFNAASKGIYLGVTTPTASNLLDDYEEGTWTPEITPATGSFTAITYSNREGHYTKIGNIVYFNMFLRTASSSNFSGASGVITITGLPFISSSTPIVRAGGSFFTAFDRWNSNSILDGSIVISTSITPSSSSIGLASIITSTGDSNSFTVSNLRDVSATDNRIGLTGFYMTD